MRKIFKILYLERLKYHGLKLGKNLQMEKGCNIDSVFPSLIEIKNNVTLARNTYILSHDGSSKKIVGFTKVGRVIINDNVFIGANSIVFPNVEIGTNSIIGANSVVNKSIPPNEVWAGNPAKFICKLETFLQKRSLELKQHEPLLLNGKRTYKINKKTINKFMEDMTDVTIVKYIE